MKAIKFLSNLWNFFRKMFFPYSDDFKPQPIRVEKIVDENILAENMIKNNQIKASGEDEFTFGRNSVPYQELFKEEPIFDKKEVAETEVQAPVETKKIRRILEYRIETKQGLILYEGRKLGAFLKKNPGLKLKTNNVYMFASRNQSNKLYKDKYFVSFKEIAQ